MSAHQRVSTDVPDDNKYELGTKLDAPKLVRLADDWYVGAEAGHDFRQTSIREGNFVYGKLTYNGCLLNCK